MCTLSLDVMCYSEKLLHLHQSPGQALLSPLELRAQGQGFAQPAFSLPPLECDTPHEGGSGPVPHLF